MTAWWRWYAAIGVASCLVYFALPDRLWAQSLFVAVGVSAVTAIVVGTRIHRPRNSSAWLTIAAGTAMWVLGDVVYEWLFFTRGEVPYPSAADVVYLLGYPLYGYGLFLLVRRRWGHAERGHVANSAIVMVAFGLVTWVFAVQPFLGEKFSGLSGLVDVTYPAVDIFLLGLLVHFVGARQWRATSYRILTVSVLLLLVTDTANNFSVLARITAERTILDVGWVLSYVLMGVAALHPSMRRIPHTSRGPDEHLMASFTTPTVIVLTAATLTAPVVMTLEVVRQEPILEWGWAVLLCAAALVVLIMFRITDLLRLLHTQTVQLRAAADTDHLTGLANRRALEHWIRSNSLNTTLLTVDIDRFKEINDTFGRGLGDQVLRVVADRLRTIADDSILLARMAGDEFALCGVRDSIDPSSLSNAVQHQFSTPFEVENMTLLIEASVGIASTARATGGPEPDPIEDGSLPGRLVQQADLAVQTAKSAQSRIAYYDRSMEKDKREQLIMLGELTTALATDQLELYYQPQVDLFSMTVTGVEALLRWNHPNGTVLQPDSFLPTAERTGLIRPLTEYVLHHALAHRAQWASAGLDLRLAVNISTRNLFDDTLIDQVATALNLFDCPADRLTLEVTETSAMTDPAGATTTLTALRGLGVELAIDDYGTGYSSLAYIERLPVQELKIDKIFVTGMSTEPTHAAIVRSTIELAGTLGLTVTAEGVEDVETVLALRALRCRRAQGYVLARPTTSDRLAGVVAELGARLQSSTAERIS